MRVRIVDTRIDHTQRPIPKNFGIQIEDDELLVPQELVAYLGGRNNVKTPESLVSVIVAFPSALLELFIGASIDEVADTKAEFFTALEGKVPGEFLNPPPPPKRAYNALPPPGMEWQAGRTVQDISFVKDAEVCVLLFEAVEKAKKIKSGELDFSVADSFSELGIDFDSQMMPGRSREEEEQRLLDEFISMSEQYLRAKVPSLGERSVELLRAAIGQVKRGKLVLPEFTTPEQYLKVILILH